MTSDWTQPPRWFWDILARATDRHALSGALPDDQLGLMRFINVLRGAMAELQTDAFRDANCPGASEDVTQDVAEWVVTRGPDAYARALRGEDVGVADLRGSSPGYLAEALAQYRTRYNRPPPPMPD